MSARWPVVKLGEVLTLDLDRVPVDASTSYPMVGVLSFGRGLFRREPVENGKTSYRAFYRLKAEHVVMSQLFGWEGALALGSEKFAGMYLSPQFPTFLCEATKLDRAFLGWLMRRPTFWADLGSRASGMGDRRRTLTPDALFKCEIPLPPLSDQRRIVAGLEELGAQIEEACRLRKEALKGAEGLFEQARAQVFKQAASHGVRTLSETATLERGKFSHRPRNDQQFFGGNHPWIQIAEIERSTKYIREWSETLNDAALAISKKFPKGTVLISIAATIGAVGILDFDCCIPDSIVGVTPKERMDSEFLYHYLAYVRTHLESIAPQSAQKNINLQILAPLPVPRVTHSLQRRIVAELEALHAEVERLKTLQGETAAELDALLPAILDRAFRGEL